MSCRFLKFLLALVILMATMILPKDFLFAMQVSQQVAESVIDNSETERLELKLTPYSVDSYGEGNLYNLNAEGVTVANTPVILYARKNVVLYLGLADETQRPFVEYYPDRKEIRSANLVKDKSFFTFEYVPVFITDQKEDAEPGGTFLSRNKFWVMGGAAIIGSGAAVLITSLSEGSPTYLPIPPGRP